MIDIRKLAAKHGKFAPEAYQFLFDALETAVQVTGRDTEEGVARHVSGRELLEGLRILATKTFGPLAAQVWRAWGIHGTLDWGRLVFLLVEENMLNRQDDDSIDDFADGFDFEEVFVHAYIPELPPEIGPAVD